MPTKETENEILCRVFVPPDLDYVPPDIEAMFERRSDAELEHGLVRGENVKTVIAIQQGWALIILKKRHPHAEFQKRLEALRWPYEKANAYMNLARGCLRHPDLQKITSLDMLRRIFYLPEAKQADIEIKVKEEIGRGHVRTWKDLRGWIVSEIANEAVRKQKRENVEARRTPEERAKLIEEAKIVRERLNNPDQDWLDLKGAHVFARSAMQKWVEQLAKLKKSGR